MNMRLLISTLFCSFILLLPVPSFAQDQDDANGWSVEQRCAAQAITPPDDWKFDGTIFTWDWDGIRAVNAAIPTPYFVLFDSEFMEGAALSPDGRWYAIPDGFGVPANVSETEFWYEIRKIHFYSTDGRREHHDIPWEMTFRPYVNKIVWLDNDHIAYPAGDWVHYHLYSVDHMTGEQRLLNLPTVSNGSTFRADPLAPTLSPDHTRYVADGNLIEVATGNTIIQLFENTSKPMQTLWTPDSAYFISADGTLAGTENTTHAISFYNRDGDFLNTIALFQGIFFDLAMSPGGRYVKWDQGQDGLFVADLTTRTIINYCDFPQNGGGAVWSPDGKQLAYAYENTLYVLELSSAQTYKLPYSFSNRIQRTIAWGQS